MEPYHYNPIASDILNYANSLFTRACPIPELAELSSFFERLKGDYHPRNSMHTEARGTLFTLYQMTGMDGDKITTLFESIIPIEVDSPRSDNSSPVDVDLRVLETKEGGYSPVPGTSAFIQFFSAYEEVRKLVLDEKSPNEVILKKLDHIFYECLIDGVLQEIPKDHLELRRLSFLQFALKNISELYGLAESSSPENIEELEEKLNLRLATAYEPATFPESILFEMTPGASLTPPFEKNTISRLMSFVSIFATTLPENTPEENAIILNLIEIMAFDIASILHLMITKKTFSTGTLTSYKKKNPTSNSIATIKLLISDCRQLPGILKTSRPSPTRPKPVANTAPLADVYSTDPFLGDPFLDDLLSSCSRTPHSIKIKEGGYSSTSDTPAFIQFFHAFKEAFATLSNHNTPSESILDALDHLLYECYIEGSLSQIPRDHLELRRLSFLKYAIGEIIAGYNLVNVDFPDHAGLLEGEIDTRIAVAHRPATFPESILFQLIDNECFFPLTEHATSKLMVFLSTFPETLAEITEEEREITLYLMELIAFNAISNVHLKLTQTPFPLLRIKSYKNKYKPANSIETIKSLLGFLRNLKGAFVSPSLLEEFPYPPMMTTASAESLEDEAVELPAIKTAVEVLQMVEAKKTHPTPPMSSSSSGDSFFISYSKEKPTLTTPAPLFLPSKPFQSPFPFFTAGLAALHENQLEEALNQTHHIIESYQSLLNARGGIREGRKNHEQLFEFFNLVSIQIGLLQHNNPDDNEAYEANLIKLESCKAAHQAYCKRFNPIENTTQNLNGFLEHLARIREELTTVAARPEKRLRGASVMVE